MSEFKSQMWLAREVARETGTDTIDRAHREEQGIEKIRNSTKQTLLPM